MGPYRVKEKNTAIIQAKRRLALKVPVFKKKSWANSFLKLYYSDPDNYYTHIDIR
jgi:hypothetical protein